ncbi:MAG: hypothetical protein J0I37_04700 [Microbacterium sp.]|nr:hypothetical protein [Microbacterium sp.]
MRLPFETADPLPVSLKSRPRIVRSFLGEAWSWLPGRDLLLACPLRFHRGVLGSMTNEIQKNADAFTASSDSFTATSKSVSRRTLVKGAAWSVPVIAAATAVPMAAASSTTPGSACDGCIVADPAHQGLAANADTWLSLPFANGDGTYGTLLWVVWAFKYDCPLGDDVLYVTYSVTFDNAVGEDPSTTITTSDGGTAHPVFLPGAAASPPAGVGAASVVGIKYGPGVTGANIDAQGSGVLLASNVPWSQNPTDGTTGPTAAHHITDASFSAVVNVHVVYKNGTQKDLPACPVQFDFDMGQPYPGTPNDPSFPLYWTRGVLTTSVGTSGSLPSAPCSGCISGDPTHQGLGPLADTWTSGAIANTDGTFGTWLWAVWAFRYDCALASDIHHITYNTVFDSHVNEDPSTTITTNDGGTTHPTYTVGSYTPPAGVDAAAVTGILYGPGVAGTNVSAAGSGVLLGSNIPWSQNPTDPTGPSAAHHITQAKLTVLVNVQVTYKNGTTRTMPSCPVTFTLDMGHPYPGGTTDQSLPLYWLQGITTTTAAS